MSLAREIKPPKGVLGDRCLPQLDPYKTFLVTIGPEIQNYYAGIEITLQMVIDHEQAIYRKKCSERLQRGAAELELTMYASHLVIWEHNKVAAVLIPLGTGLCRVVKPN